MFENAKINHRLMCHFIPYVTWNFGLRLKILKYVSFHTICYMELVNMIEYVNSFLLLTMSGSTFYVYYSFFYLISIIKLSLNGFRNT